MNNNKLLKDIIRTRTILKEKLKNIKLNEADKFNLLEDTFKPVTKPLNKIIKKIDDYQFDDLLEDTFKSKTKPLNEIIKKDNDDDYQSNADITPPLPSENSSNNYDDAVDYNQATETDLKKNPLVENIEVLMNNKRIDTIYGFNIDESGNWRYGNNELNFNEDNSIQIGNSTWKMTPGLFELVFHSKPLHYNKNDLKKYKEILISTNAHKRQFHSKSQIKGTRAYKYVRIIKNLFNTTPNVLTKGSGLSLKTIDNRKSSYIYWNDSNELVDRLRLLIASESVGHNNHKNEIISIIEELKEADIIY